MNALAFILLLAASEPEHIRSMEYVARINGNGALIAEGITSNDPAAQSAALQAAHDFKDTAMLAGLLAKVSPTMQISLVGLLARRGDPVAMPAVAALARSADADVRAAALRALGPLGDASVVRLLAEAAVNGEKAARQSLLELHRGDVAGAMLSELSSAKLQAEVARALAQRAEPTAVAAMVKLYLDTKSDVLREALSTVCQRSKSAAEPVLNALAAGNAEALLPVCGELVDPRVRAALRAAGGRALCATRDPELVPDLIAVARDNSDASLRVLAFRSAARLARDAETFKQLLMLAKRPEEKKLVLAGLAGLSNQAALDVVSSLLNDADVRAEATQATREIQAAMGGKERNRP